MDKPAVLLCGPVGGVDVVDEALDDAVGVVGGVREDGVGADDEAVDAEWEGKTGGVGAD